MKFEPNYFPDTEMLVSINHAGMYVYNSDKWTSSSLN